MDINNPAEWALLFLEEVHRPMVGIFQIFGNCKSGSAPAAAGAERNLLFNPRFWSRLIKETFLGGNSQIPWGSAMFLLESPEPAQGKAEEWDENPANPKEIIQILRISKVF